MFFRMHAEPNGDAVGVVDDRELMRAHTTRKRVFREKGYVCHFLPLSFYISPRRAIVKNQWSRSDPFLPELMKEGIGKLNMLHVLKSSLRALAILGRLELPDQGYEPHPPPGGSDPDTGRGYRLPEKMTKGILKRTVSD